MINESDVGMENRILPDTSTAMAFRYKGLVKDKSLSGYTNLPQHVLSGLRKVPRIINYSKNTATFIVHFKEGGAATFFKESIHEVFGLNASLDNFFSASEINEIAEKLAEVKNSQQQIALVEQFLISKLTHFKPDLLVSKAIETIQFANGNIKIKELVSQLNISIDPFEKRFRFATGAAPKQFSNIVRLRNVIKRHSHYKSYTDMALTAGYFDQAHFIHDFKIFTGQTPKDFFKSAFYI